MATKIPLLPCINRNYSCVLDVTESGVVAYGSRCSIYIFNFRGTIPIIDDLKFIPNAHRGKITSLSFCKTNDQIIASVGDDNFIRIWDLETQTSIASLEVREGVRVVEWLYENATSVSYPGNMGYVSKWNYITNNLAHIKTGSDSFVQILSSNKMSSELLAAGHSVGSISVLNMHNLTLLHKLKCHAMEITSLCWSTVSPTMLLSTSLDQTARVWKMGEYKPFRTYCYPRSRKIDDKKYQMKYCGMFHPENPDVIICSNVRSGLGEITFKEGEEPKFDPYDDRNSDTNFKSVNIMLPYLTENNKALLLVSDHLKISLWDASERKLLSSFLYLNGNVYDVAACPLNPYNLAIGAADGCLRVWNLSESSRVDVTSIMLYSRIKIMSVAWHPSAEGILAYGSDEGRIGIADVQRKKSLYSYETHHSNSIYAMQWAPCLKIKDSDEDFFLYSCGGGVIYIHELNKPKDKPADFDDLISYPPDLEFVQKTHSELSWKSDYTCLIIGSFKGFLDLFDNKFNFLTRVTMQMKIVESIKWHPRYTFTSSKGSDYSSWFAAAGNDDNIQIFDTSDMKSGQSEAVPCRPTKTLIGHKKKISSLCWSPHSDGYLASASRDGTVLVWNVITSTIIANYPWHKELVYAVHWSYFDPDTIYSGGMDSCLRVWKISEQIKSAPEKCQVIRRKAKPVKIQENNRKEKVSRKEREKASEKDLSCNESYDSNNDINETLKDLKVSKTEEFSTNESSKEKISQTKSDVKEHTSRQRQLFSGYMVGSKGKKLENVLKLTDLLSQPLDSSDPENMTLISDLVTDEESLHCGFYCDQLTTLKMLENKAKNERKAGNNEKANFFQLIANNVEPLLISAAENKKLTDFLMAAAVTVSRKFYNEMCQKYAMQLIEERHYTKAGLYLAFCGELHNAVKALLEKGRVLEALALAKARLPEDDPFIRGALIKVSNYFSAYHETEYEAECYLAMKEPAEAAKTLYRNNDSSSIYVSAYICKKFNLIEEAESYGYLCMEKCLTEAAWPTFYKVVDLIDSLKVYKLLVRVHELIFTEMKTLKKDGIFPKLFGVTGSKLQIWENKTYGSSNISFLPFIYDILKSDNIIPEEKESLKEIHNALDSLIAKRQKYETSEEAHINIAIHISQAIVSALLNDFSDMQKFILKVFSTAYNVAFLPRVVLWLFLPFDICWCSNKDAFICENKYLESQLLSFPYLQDVYKSLCDKFTTVNISLVEDFSINHTFSSNMSEAAEKVLNILSKKTCEDSLVLYFSACYIAELRKLAKQGWKFRCYTISCDKEPKQVIHENGNSHVACNEKSSEKDICNNQKNIKEHDVESEVNCCENTDQNIASDVSLTEKDITHCPLQDKDSILFNNCASVPVLENDLIVSNSSLTLEENVTNTVKTRTSNLFNKLQDFLFVTNNGTVLENSIIENPNSKVENEIPSTKEIEISSIEKIENGTLLTNDNEVEKDMYNVNGKVEVKEMELTNINDKTEENEKLSSVDLSHKVEEMSPEDDHLQCWSDISLFYILTKSFTSINCRDEYALFFYLQKYLHYLDNTIADISRQKSVKSVLGNPKILPDIVKDESPLDEDKIHNNMIKIEENHQKSLIIKCSSNDVKTSDSLNPEELAHIGENESPLNTNDICCNLVKVEENSTSCSLKNVELSNFKGIDSSHNCNNDFSILEKEMKKEVDEIQVKSDLIVNSDEKGELPNETAIKLPNQISEDGTNSVLQEKGITQEQMVLENLHLEHEKVSHLLKVLNIAEFDYPNPFDAVSAINGLCCDIFRKNPCNFVREKFHEFAHEVNKWNAKFYVQGETLKCDICNEIISV